MNSRNLVVLFALAFPATAGAAPTDAEWQKLVKEAKLTIGEAIDRGVKEAGGGTPFQAELEVDKGNLVYSIDISLGARSANPVIDAKDGKVVENSVEDKDRSAKVKDAKISLKAAIKEATKKAPGTPVRARLVVDGGKPIAEVRVFAGTITEVRLDGVTGKVLSAGPPPPKPDAGAAAPKTTAGQATPKPEASPAPPKPAAPPK